MANRKYIHVVPYDSNKWATRREGATRVSSIHRTQTAATNSAARTARREQGEVVIHRPSGEIRDRDSYGNDPASRKDTKF